MQLFWPNGRATGETGTVRVNLSNLMKRLDVAHFEPFQVVLSPLSLQVADRGVRDVYVRTPYTDIDSIKLHTRIIP